MFLVFNTSHITGGDRRH